MQHDWDLILKNAGEEPVAPSAMRWFDTSLDAGSTRLKYQRRIHSGQNGIRADVFEHSDSADLATMNLIATHFGYVDRSKKINASHLINAFTSGLSVSDIRRYVLLALIEESATGRNTIPRVNALTQSDDPVLLEYPISTDRGLAAQLGLIRFLLTICDRRFYKIVLVTLGSYTPNGKQHWFSDEHLLRYVLDNPAQAELIAETIIKRESTDLDLLRTIINSDATMLSEGLL